MSAPCLSPSCERMLLPGQGITVGTDRFCDLECWSMYDPVDAADARDQLEVRDA